MNWKIKEFIREMEEKDKAIQYVCKYALKHKFLVRATVEGIEIVR